MLFLATPLHAETRYVSDQLVVTVREGASNQRRVLTTVETDDAVEVLSEGPRYIKLKTQNGVIGFSQKKYFTTATPKPVVIAQLESENAALKERIRSLEEQQQAFADTTGKTPEQWQQIQAQLDQSIAQRDELAEEYRQLREQSTHVIEIRKERNRLKQQNQFLSERVNTLQQENASLLRSGMINWFLAGAGVFFGGWIVGKTSRRKRSTFS